jgi:hypothetical protein
VNCIRRSGEICDEAESDMFEHSMGVLAIGGAIHLDHGEPSAGGRNGIAFSCVSLLSNSQCVQLGLESAPIGHRRYSKFIPRFVSSVMTNGLRHFCLHRWWQKNV